MQATVDNIFYECLRLTRLLCNQGSMIASAAWPDKLQGKELLRRLQDLPHQGFVTWCSSTLVQCAARSLASTHSSARAPSGPRPSLAVGL